LNWSPDRNFRLPNTPSLKRHLQAFRNVGAESGTDDDAAANLLRANRNLPQAVELLKRYLSGKTVEDGPTFKAHALLGQVYEKQGDQKAAAAEFRAALALASGFRPAREGLKRTGGS